MTVDVNYLAKGIAEQPVPFVISGSCEGAAKLLQKCIVLILTDKDPIFRPGAVGLYTQLKSASAQASTVNIINNILTEAANTIQLTIQTDQQDLELSDDEKLYSFTASSAVQEEKDSLSVEFIATTVSGKEASATLEV